ncbi:MAG TPA: hypothetical protein IAA19_01510 [Candidatus Olsenella pullistercoris]|uniref:Uncharacterized protein n=1 Tax=Candidatus Olsenella pullistercoris TaxID=2838712 RepID=A0A9D2EYN4_9ACTN|nr:hypothetical protein [Candidatus Olsenella pullistercoris]
MTETTVEDVCRSAFDVALETIRRGKDSREGGPVDTRSLLSDMNPIFRFGGTELDLETAEDVVDLARRETRGAVRDILLSTAVLAGIPYRAPESRREPFALSGDRGWTAYVICGSAEDRLWLTPLLKEARRQGEPPSWGDVRRFRRISLYDARPKPNVGESAEGLFGRSDANPSVATITLRMFFDAYFEPGCFDKFLVEAGRYVEEAREVIGYRTVPTPTKGFLARFKEDLARGLKEDVPGFAEELRRDGLRDDQVELMRRNFVERGRLRALVGALPFADSFISSEWFYKVDHETDALEKTGVVSGYLKSIEQLLRHLTDLIKDEGWTISLPTKGGYKRFPLSSDCDEADRRNLGALQFFFGEKSNKDLFCVNGNSRRLLVSKLGRWREKNRNGLFHFDNVHDEDNVKEIRRQTRFLYFLILGSWRRESLVALGAPPEGTEQGEPVFDEESFRRWFEDGLAPLASRQWVLDDAGTVVLYYCIDRDWWRTDRRGDGANRERHWEMRLEVRGQGSGEPFGSLPPLHTAREAYHWVSDDEGVLEDVALARLLASRALSESTLFEKRGELPDLRVFDLDTEASRTMKADPGAFPSNSLKSRGIDRKHAQ